MSFNVECWQYNSSTTLKLYADGQQATGAARLRRGYRVFKLTQRFPMQSSSLSSRRLNKLPTAMPTTRTVRHFGNISSLMGVRRMETLSQSDLR